MDPQNVLSAPSVGSLVKKILAINSEFEIADIIQIIRQSTRMQKNFNDGFGAQETIDENKALELARSLSKNQ